MTPQIALAGGWKNSVSGPSGGLTCCALAPGAGPQRLATGNMSGHFAWWPSQLQQPLPLEWPSGFGGRTVTNGNHKPVQELIADLKEELKEFLNTRFAMLRAEMTEKANNIRMVAPVLLIGV